MVATEREYLCEALEKTGCKVFGGSADFILLKSEIKLYELLLKKGILIRDCSNMRGLSEGYYRVAVKTHEENELLVNEIWNLR